MADVPECLKSLTPEQQTAVGRLIYRQVAGLVYTVSLSDAKTTAEELANSRVFKEQSEWLATARQGGIWATSRIPISPCNVKVGISPVLKKPKDG